MDFTKFMARYRETVKREGGYAARMQKHLAAEKVDAAQVAKLRAKDRDSSSSALLKVAEVLTSAGAPPSMLNDV